MKIKPFSFLLSLHEAMGSPKLHVNQDQTLGCVCSRQAHLLLLQKKIQPKSNQIISFFLTLSLHMCFGHAFGFACESLRVTLLEELLQKS
jgi:hypothetical protein